MITQAYLKELIYYNPNTGIFAWALSRRRVKKGDIAGSHQSQGYLQIMVGGERHLAHRLAWFYMTGNWPEDQIDHINQIKADNRWCNLRECDQSQNQANTGNRSDNTSGYKGVTWSKKEKKWYSQIHVKGKHLHLGVFKSKHQAAITYNKKADELFGEFAHLNKITAGC